MSDQPRLPRIAVFAGPTATITNTPPLVTSNAARRRHGLPLLPGRFDALRPQRLAAPVTVYVHAHSAHPLESDAAGLYAAPDGWLDADGTFTETEPPLGGVAVYAIELRPDDGLYPLPYAARQADGSAWEQAATDRLADWSRTRQTFFPDADRLYEEIDRFGLGADGRANQLSSVAAFEHVRAAPSGGYRQEHGAELPGEDFFNYQPFHLRTDPHLGTLATITNTVQRTLDRGDFCGAQWLEGSSTAEETLYWLGLLVDTTTPIVGHVAQRMHQMMSADGARNILDGVRYLTSGVALDERGRDRVGPVLIVDEVAFSAREAAKTDARPGNFVAVGGHGGVVADLGARGPRLTSLPVRSHTWRSELRLSALPGEVRAVIGSLGGGVAARTVPVRAADGSLLAEALPRVSVVTYARYQQHDADTDPHRQTEIMALLAEDLGAGALAGFVAEGMAPYGLMNRGQDNALAVATFAGMPVVHVGRGNTAGMAHDLGPLVISGDNLSATKARLLLMASLLKLGALPPAEDPFAPTRDEVRRTRHAVAAFQRLFDTH